MHRYPRDRFVIASSPVYISAIERDILAGIPALSDAGGQLVVVTSQAYRGALEPFLSRSHAEMLTSLRTNMTCLNIAWAGALIEQLQISGRRAGSC